MIRVGITGASGFLGIHARSMLAPLESRSEVSIKNISRADLEDQTVLAALVHGCDVILHLAGSNRGSEDDIRAANEGLAQKLVDACNAAGVAPHIIFASSIYADERSDMSNQERPAAFGESKREAARIFTAWGERSGAPVSVFILPHVFGEFAPPFHNSAIATLCHQLARGESSDIRSDAQVELVYVRSAMQRMLQAVLQQESGVIRIKGEQRKLQEVYKSLRDRYVQYMSGETVECADALESQLLLTLHYHVLASFPESTI